MVLERFKICSRTEISRFICCHPNVKDLTTAVNEAIEFEVKENDYQTKTKYCSYCCTSTHNTNECRSKNKKVNNDECSYCHIKGHTWKECCKQLYNERLKQSPPENRQVNTIEECKFCKQTGHIIQNCWKLAYKKKVEPEKYDCNHPNYQGTKKPPAAPQNDEKEIRKISAIGQQKLILEFNSPQATARYFQFMVNNGAFTSLVCYNALTTDAKQCIDRSIIQSINQWTQWYTRRYNWKNPATNAYC